ncbi:MAG TPA: GNAT family N-acetyltransferase, partial [Chloroflexia bacterium]|nr:GNAT family N-acetyltransferase [Chloroflexia bacterium]
MAYNRTMHTTTTTIRQGTPEDDAAIVPIINRSAPHLPPASVARMRHHAATTPAGATREFHLAERAGQVCAYAMLESRWWTDDPASFSLDLTVDPAVRGDGIGTRLYTQVLERAATLQATQLYAAVRDDLPAAARFAAARGFVPSGHTLRWARLRVSHAPLAALDAVADSLEAAGNSIVALAELDADEPLLRRVYEVDCESAQDEPAAQSYEPQPFEQWRTWI